VKIFLTLPMHTARIPPVDADVAVITAALAIHSGHMVLPYDSFPASARALIPNNWRVQSLSNLLVHSCNGRIPAAFTL
jgi:hypothetical protein